MFLISLKAGGVALNLTEASRVFLMDSWWNPAVEYQAMDVSWSNFQSSLWSATLTTISVSCVQRIHRLGQRRPVVCTKLCIEDSIESKIIQLRESFFGEHLPTC